MTDATVTTPGICASQAIAEGLLETLRSSNPLTLRRAELMRMRDAAIAAGMQLLGTARPPEAIQGHPLPDYALAVQFVLGYEGRDTFMRDLRRWIATYGGLTEGQAQAVLAPPWAQQEDEMEARGISGVQYRWQAKDLLRLPRTADEPSPWGAFRPARHALGDWATLLEPHGGLWSAVGCAWWHPEPKTKGTLTARITPDGNLWFYQALGPFEAGTSYSPFIAWELLNPGKSPNPWARTSS